MTRHKLSIPKKSRHERPLRRGRSVSINGPALAPRDDGHLQELISALPPTEDAEKTVQVLVGAIGLLLGMPAYHQIAERGHATGRMIGHASAMLKASLTPISIALGMDVAIPCGIVVNELVTNALKHAFAPPRRETAKIEIELVAGDSPCATLVVRDNGSGLPPCIDVTSTQSEGLALVRAMAEQLGAKMEVSTGHGTEFKLAFCVGDG